MGDFERIFGAGADIESIIDGINSANSRAEREMSRDAAGPARKSFSSFQEAAAWAKNNPGTKISRSPGGSGFIVIEGKGGRAHDALQKIEEQEFEQLVAEMAPLGFTKSSQVSWYILENKLGYKYKNISGIVQMEKNGTEWKFEGGFPPYIYGRLCSELGLENQKTRARAVGFQAFKDLNPPDFSGDSKP